MSINTLPFLLEVNIVGILFFGFIFLVFAVVISIIIKSAAENVSKDFRDVKSESQKIQAKKIAAYENATGKKITVIKSKQDSFWEYSGFVFHLISSALLLFLIFSGQKSAYEKTFDYLLQTNIFQFKSSLMFILIGLVNPFIVISDEKRKFLTDYKSDPSYGAFAKFLEFVTRPNILRIIKSLLAAYIFAAFLRHNFFIIPWSSGVTIATFYLFMVVYYIISNLYRLIFYPEEFMLYNRASLRIIGNMIIPFIFLSALTAVGIMLLGSLLKLDLSNITAESMPFLAYNMMMTYVSWVIART